MTKLQSKRHAGGCVGRASDNEETLRRHDLSSPAGSRTRRKQLNLMLSEKR
jgi:hypothetical protein